MNYLGKFIEKKLIELNLSEREMAGRCSISHSYLNQIIKGLNPQTRKPISPTISTFEKLSRGFKISIEDLQKISRGVPEEEVFIETKNNRIKFLENLEKIATKEGIPIGSKGDRTIPWEVWNQIKEAQDFISCLGLDPSEHSKEDWEKLMDDIGLVVRLYLERKKPKNS